MHMNSTSPLVINCAVLIRLGHGAEKSKVLSLGLWGGPTLPISNFLGAASICSEHVGDGVSQAVCMAECDGSIPTAIICHFFFFCEIRILVELGYSRGRG